MGNQSSKEGGSSKSLEVPGPSLDSYPSLGKSDTKESSRSFRGIRSKIPGTSKTDSPRASMTGLADGVSSPLSPTNSTDNQKDGATNASSGPTSPNGDSGTPNGSDTALPVRSRESIQEDPQPPPSPSQSATLGGGHKADNSAQVDNISELPPSQFLHPSIQKPGESILVKNRSPGPRSKSKERRSLSKDRSISKDRRSITPSDTMEIAELKTEHLDEMIQRLLDAGYQGKVTKSVALKTAEIEVVCRTARELFLSQPALLELSPPVKIVGDIHGQYTDLLRLFEMCGFPPESNYLFLGDYVDRGKQSLETILLLLCYKLKYPENFFLLRGNHESANVTRVYGFFDECKRRLSTKIWKTFVDCFNTLPIAAIVAGKIFCVHGGLSPALQHMDDIRQIARPTDVPDYGLLNDLLWSDPQDQQSDWASNERGVSYCFGKQVIMDFLQRHDFDLVCRAHMVVEDGYEFFADRILVTVFSAPNYCGEFDNYGAVMSVSGELLCSFELLKPLDSTALKSHIKKSRNARQNMLNSPPASQYPQSF